MRWPIRDKDSLGMGIAQREKGKVMAAMAGVLNHSLTAAQALAGTGANPTSAAPADSGADGSSGSSSATVSANDFLTLLVTEMQNQDPTAQTDPNEYINQLVQVNSLEQLISINQNLQTVLGTASGMAGSSPGVIQSAQGQTGDIPAATSATTVAGAGPAGTAAPGLHAAGATSAGGGAARASSTAQAIGEFAQSVTAKRAQGNLSIPEGHAVAHKVAHALDGHSHTPLAPGKRTGAP